MRRGACLAALAAVAAVVPPTSSPPPGGFPAKPIWTMPPIETLPPPARSPARTIALVVLRGYLLLAAAAVLIKVMQLIAAS